MLLGHLTTMDSCLFFTDQSEVTGTSNGGDNIDAAFSPREQRATPATQSRKVALDQHSARPRPWLSPVSSTVEEPVPVSNHNPGCSSAGPVNNSISWRDLVSTGRTIATARCATQRADEMK